MEVMADHLEPTRYWKHTIMLFNILLNPRLGDGGRMYTDVWGIGSEAYSELVIASYMARDDSIRHFRETRTTGHYQNAQRWP